MDSDQPRSTGRKVKFAPKAPPPRTRSRTRAAVQLKAEEADDAAKAQELLRHFNELDSIQRQRPKAENKSAVQATFIYGPKQSAAAGASNVTQDRSHRSRLELKHSDNDDDDDDEQIVIPSSFTDEPSELKKNSTSDPHPKTKVYREPWDYAHSFYPTTLPWRRPYSGDPDILDEAEFGEVSRNVEYDESGINPAAKLGFLDFDESSENTRLLFFQLPPLLPVIKRSAGAKGKEKEGTSATPDQRAAMASAAGGKGSSVRATTSRRSCSLEELPAGKMGKLLVYKSGVLQLKLGDILYDVSPGSDCAQAQDAVAINTKAKECCAIGELHSRALVTPAIDHLLDSVIDLV